MHVNVLIDRVPLKVARCLIFRPTLYKRTVGVLQTAGADVASLNKMIDNAHTTQTQQMLYIVWCAGRRGVLLD